MFLVFVVRCVELCDDVDCICCMCALMGSLSLDIGQGSCNKVSFSKRVSSSLPTMNSDTCCSMLEDEFVRRTDMGVR